MRRHLSDVAAAAVMDRPAPRLGGGEAVRQVQLAAARLAETDDFTLLLDALRQSAVLAGGVPDYVADTDAAAPITFDRLAPFAAVRAGQASVVHFIDQLVAAGRQPPQEDMTHGGGDRPAQPRGAGPRRRIGRGDA